MVLCSLNRTFAVENLYTMRKTVHYIILLTLVLSACTSPSHEAMRQRLKYVSDCNRADTVFTERWLPTVDSLVTYFDRHGSANDRMMAHYVQGRVYHDMGEAPQALECYQKAAEQADTTSSDCDYRQLSRIYGQTAHLFLQQNLPANAQSELVEASVNALRAGDTITYISCLEQTVMALYEQQRFEQATDMGGTIFSLYTQAGDTVRAYGCLPLFIMSALRSNNVEVARKWLDLYEKESGFVDDHKHVQEGHEVYYALKGKHELLRGEYVKAEKDFRMLIGSTKRQDLLLKAFQGLYEAYHGLHMTDSMGKYAVLYSQYNDSTTMALRSKELQQQELLYNYSHSQETAALMSAKAAKSQMNLLVVLLSIAVLLFLVSLLFTHYWIRLKSKIKRANFSYFSHLMLYIREQMKLQVMLDSDERDHKAIDGQQEIVDNLKIQMGTYHDPKMEVWDVDDMLLNNRIILHFHELAVLGKKPDMNEWTEFRQCINYQLPGFLTLVGKMAEIGIQETNVCLLVKLLFTPSEICALLNIRPQTLTNIRARLLLKMFGKQGGAKEFDNEIKQLTPTKMETGKG